MLKNLGTTGRDSLSIEIIFNPVLFSANASSNTCPIAQAKPHTALLLGQVHPLPCTNLPLPPTALIYCCQPSCQILPKLGLLADLYIILTIVFNQ